MVVYLHWKYRDVFRYTEH